jgi:hypothetical protein
MADSLNPLLDKCRGRGNVLPFLRNLESATTVDGDTRFNVACRQFQARYRRRSVVIVISDFLFPTGFEDGLNFLQWNNHDVYCLQVQNDADTRCTWKGDVELECVETGQRRRVTISPREAALYEQAVANWNHQLTRGCARRGIGLASTTPEIPFERVIQEILRRGGLVA